MGIREKRRRSNLAAQFFLLIVCAGAATVAGLLAYSSFGNRGLAGLGAGSPDLNPAERAMLTAYLATRSRDLTTPAGTDPTPVDFTVAAGETAGAVAERLAAASLINDAQLLTYYLRYLGLDSQVEAGDFILRQTMTLPEVARALTDALAREVIVRVTEGWRMEQIAEALALHAALADRSDDFRLLAGPNSPRANAYGFLDDLGPGASLEGYLFPDTYLFRPDATASDILNKLLANFEARLPAGYRDQVAARGLTLHQAITVASLIEREAVAADERPVIASVIYNRLAAGQLLEIDAAVQYALGQPGDWWPRLEGLDLRTIVSPYNTYAVPGLPPGPIANPGLDSILAAANPAQTNYLYYRALCDGSGRHAFAATYEEHLANACQ
jgi:UPF0755 protein